MNAEDDLSYANRLAAQEAARLVALEAEVAAHEAEMAKSADIRWRQWAIEKLLASPAAAGLTTPRWVVKPGDFVEVGQGPTKLSRLKRCEPEYLACPLYAMADDIVAYITTGAHPDADETNTTGEGRV